MARGRAAGGRVSPARADGSALARVRPEPAPHRAIRPRTRRPPRERGGRRERSSPDDLGRRRLPARARSDARRARRDRHRGAVRAGRRALRQGRRAGRRYAGAHPGRARRGRPQERAARLDDQAARRRHRAASSSTPRTRYCGTGSDVLYVCDPETRERRRVRRADVEGMAALCEKLPNIDFVMSMGLPEDAPQAIDDLVQVDAMMRGTRKPLLVAPRDGHILAQDAGDGGAGRRGRTASASTRCRCLRSSSTRTAPAR